MTQSNNTQPMTNEEKEKRALEWDRDQFVKVQKYCVSQGVQPKRVKQSKCQVLPPILGVWYVESNTKGDDFWVISGDLPTDLAPAKVAKNAREALRHFSMSWQMKAANLEIALAEGKVLLSDQDTQQKYMQELITKAELIYKISRDDKLWAGSGLTI